MHFMMDGAAHSAGSPELCRRTSYGFRLAKSARGSSRIDFRCFTSVDIVEVIALIAVSSWNR